jgi:hypothetical protein
MTTPSPNRLREAALFYASLGYSVFPCVPNKKNPLTEHGLCDATSDPDTLCEWWTKWPNANVAIVTSRLVVVDDDHPEHPWLADEPERLAEVTLAPTSRTPRGGTHRYFRAPPGTDARNSEKKIAPGADVRANGGYVLAPPSYVVDREKGSDGPYEWLDGLGLAVEPEKLPLAPAWLMEQVLATAPPAAPAASAVGTMARVDDRAAERCRAYLEKCPDSISGQGGHSKCFRAACECMRFGLSDDQAIDMLRWWSASKSGDEPWSEKEIAHKVRSARAKTEAAGQVAMYLRQAIDPQPHLAAFPEEDGVAGLRPLSLRELVQRHPKLRPPVVEGLLRQGETLNVVAPSKVGKSWLMYDLAISVAAGLYWLGAFPTVAGRVLLLDNELHGETIAHRLPAVAAARGVNFSPIADLIDVQVLRGRLTDLVSLSPYFHSLRPDHYRLVICDALYRFLPPKTDENDNGALAVIYNHVDQYADHLGAAMGMVHHSSKGNQSGKSVTDVGSGAGAQSRAADTHLILRAHKEPGAVVLDAAVRSFQPVTPRVLRWTFPVWQVADDLDPADLKPEKSKKNGKPPAKEWGVGAFVAEFVTAEPRARDLIIEDAFEKGCSRREAGRLLKVAEGKDLIARSTHGRAHLVMYATRAQAGAMGEPGGTGGHP